MTEEEKKILLSDICARIPYGLILRQYNDNYMNDYGITTDVPLIEILQSVLRGFLTIRPYLRPLSSMTENERKELSKLCNFITFCHDNDNFGHLGIEVLTDLYDKNDYYIDDNIDIRAIDWLNAHHFDYRNLIKMGLALEAPKDMYKII